MQRMYGGAMNRGAAAGAVMAFRAQDGQQFDRHGGQGPDGSIGNISPNTHPVIAFFQSALPWSALDRSGTANVYRLGALGDVEAWRELGEEAYDEAREVVDGVMCDPATGKWSAVRVGILFAAVAMLWKWYSSLQLGTGDEHAGSAAEGGVDSDSWGAEL